VSELRAVAERAIGGPATLVYRLIADFDRHHPQFLRPAFSDLQVEEGGVGAGTVHSFRMTAGGRTRSFRMRVEEPDPGRVLTESGCLPAERSAVEGGHWRPPSGVLHAEGAGPSPPGRGDGLGVMWVNACARDTAGRKVVELLVAGRRGRTVRWLLVVATVAAIQLWAGGPVWAEQPLRVDDQVTDRVGALAGEVARVRGALKRLRDANGTQLFVVYVSSFDGMDGQQWSDETARRSQLGDRDVLLAVAVDDRAYGYSVPGDFLLSDSELADLAV